MLTVGSLFSGIGGLDLGLERAGMEVRWQVEIDPYCTRVLAKHWPNVTRYGDIKAIDWKEVEPVDLICGGFPCQPVSLAGKRLAQDDPRWLWPEFARCLRVLRPRFALLENVPGILTAGFGSVLADLARLGFDASWTLLPAAAVGAPHLRYRVFLVADSVGQRIEGCWAAPIPRFPEFSWCEDIRRAEDMRDRSDLPQPLLSRKDDGVSTRMDRLGNAVVPQVAEWIGRRIMEVAS